MGPFCEHLDETDRSEIKMKRANKCLYGLMSGSTVVAVALAAAGSNAAQAASCQVTAKAVAKQNAAAEGRAKKLLGNTSYTPLIRTFTPKPSSTKGFTGYETIVVKSPKGTSPVVGYFTRKGGEACSIVIISAGVSLSRKAYVVKLKFPGEQGNPGKLRITLVSR
jgi:hypothetical protein